MTEAVVSSNITKEGDSIIVYEDINNSRILKLTSTGYLDTKFGRFLHKDMIGKEYGSKVSAKKGYVHILRPSPALITASLPHRTQILYSADISVIILKLGLKPGSIVVESGTGSGSLSSSLATAVGPTGFLYTFEFNQDRAEKAQVEFNNLGFKNIKVTWRDAIGVGFLPQENDTYQLKDAADAVFLDLPRPWDAIGHSSNVLKKGGRICSFSPCIEQVQKTCLELKAQGYVEIRTFECINRSYERKKNPYKSLSQGQGPATSNKRKGKEDLEHEIPVVKKEKLESGVVEKIPEGGAETENKEEEKEQEVAVPAVTPAETKQSVTKTDNKPKTEFYFTSGVQFIQGHTGYLTFATRV